MIGPNTALSPHLDRAKSFIYIQYLRGIAATIVVYFHTKVYLPGFYWQIDRSFGYSGVDLFFAISGFIMTVTTFHRGQSIYLFLVKRILRIYPIYWIATCLGLLVIAIIPGAAVKDGVDLRQIISSLLLIPFQNDSGTSNGLPILKIAWTLVFEVFFYAIFALSLFFIDRFTRLIFISILICGLVTYGFVIKPTSATLLFYTNPMIIEFLLGCVVGYVISIGIRVPRSLAWGLLTLCVLLIGIGSGNGDGFARVVWFGVPSACIVFCCAAFELSHTAGHQVGPLRLLGDASYAIYLFQTFFLSGVRLIADKLHLPVGTPLVGTLGVIGSVALALVGGVAIHLLVERPCLNFARHLTRRIRPKGPVEEKSLPESRIGSAV